jgi:hypothetical protein
MPFCISFKKLNYKTVLAALHVYAKLDFTECTNTNSLSFRRFSPAANAAVATQNRTLPTTILAKLNHVYLNAGINQL